MTRDITKLHRFKQEYNSCMIMYLEPQLVLVNRSYGYLSRTYPDTAFCRYPSWYTLMLIDGLMY
jgi:hypothetical protein